MMSCNEFLVLNMLIWYSISYRTCLYGQNQNPNRERILIDMYFPCGLTAWSKEHGTFTQQCKPAEMCDSYLSGVLLCERSLPCKLLANLKTTCKLLCERSLPCRLPDHESDVLSIRPNTLKDFIVPGFFSASANWRFVSVTNLSRESGYVDHLSNTGV